MSESVRICIIVVFVLIGGAKLLPAAEAPEAIHLLKGVEEARLAVASGAFEWSIVTQSHKPHKQQNKSVVRATFVGDRRTFTQTEQTLIMHPPNTEDPLQRLKQLEALGHDREAFVKAGYGKLEMVTTRSIWDGADFAQFMGSGGARYIDHTRGTPDFIFDPRTLGIPCLRQLPGRVSDSLNYTQAKNLTVLGNELIEGQKVWRVRLITNNDIQKEYWIEDRTGFRVHKYVYTDPSKREEIVSTFDARKPELVLPSQVHRKIYSTDGVLKSEVTISTIRMDLNIADDESMGRLPSLELPIGEAVSDERLLKRLGYWDGQGLTEDYLKALEIGRTRKGRTDAGKPFGWPWAITGVAAFASFIGLTLYVVRQRKAA